MNGTDILKLIDVSTKDNNVNFISCCLEHPAKNWSLEERLFYLQGLGWVLLSDNYSHIDARSCLEPFIYAFDLDEQQGIVDEVLNPCSEEKVQGFVNAFKGSSKSQIFLYDALQLSDAKKAVYKNSTKAITKLAEQLGVSVATWETVLDLFNQIKKEDWYGSIITLSSPLIDPSLFRHIYTKISLEDFLLGKRVKVPAGSFMMGSNDGEPEEEPVHKVTLKSFFMQEATVTFSQWRLFVRASGYAVQILHHIWMRNDDDGAENLMEALNKPMVEVSYTDIVGYFLPWINKLTGKNYRLPSEAEWEYAARANSGFGDFINDGISPSRANYDDGAHEEAVPVKSYSPNSFGLYNMYGNVWEWTEDCWGNDGYYDAPDDGSAWHEGDCDKRVVRGGSWRSDKDDLRSSYRTYLDMDSREEDVGFRLVLSE